MSSDPPPLDAAPLDAAAPGRAGAGGREAGPGAADAAEVAKFDALAEEWWNPRGPMAPLHAMQPVRLDFILDQICARLGRDRRARRPLDGLRLLDIGCGAGLLTAPLARLGADMTGLEPAPRARAAAERYAETHGLDIRFEGETAAQVAAEVGAGRRPAFDAVVMFEVLEHVEDRPALLSAARAALAPGGLLLLSTLNRTSASWLGAIMAAERLLGWLPRGTHDWRRFIPPSVLAAECADVGLDVVDRIGFVYRPLGRDWRRSSDDLSVNYALAALRGDAPAESA